MKKTSENIVTRNSVGNKTRETSKIIFKKQKNKPAEGRYKKNNNNKTIETKVERMILFPKP